MPKLYEMIIVLVSENSLKFNLMLVEYYEEQLSIWQIAAGGLFPQNTDFVESGEGSGRVAKLDSNLLPVLGRVCELLGS
ncbi:hypothetical protein LSM04_004028 [Trypanosoma melophagium]|uniref:uncharacterized protein n=1 Tax=Trypanosoma melophagium TaxID=715481 RepID=UPI00351A35F9|nr:hypothetical protein LSM04_004028 [Trypanosoma melophagium]